MRIEVDQEKCTGCGNCMEICPKGYRIWKKNAAGKAEVKDLTFTAMFAHYAPANVAQML